MSQYLSNEEVFGAPSQPAAYLNPDEVFGTQASQPEVGLIDKIKGFGTRFVDEEIAGMAARAKRQRQEGYDRSNAMAQDMVWRQTNQLSPAERAMVDQGKQAQQTYRESQDSIGNQTVDLIRDQGLGFTKGAANTAIKLPLALGGVIEDATGARKAMESVGYRSKDALGVVDQFGNWLDSLKSDTGQGRDKQFEATRGAGATLLELGANPKMVMDKVSESLFGIGAIGKTAGAAVAQAMPKLVAMAEAKGLTKTAAEKFVADAATRIAQVAAPVSEGAQSGLDIAGTAQQHGRTLDQYGLPALAAAASTAAIGYGSNKLGARLGIGDLETDIALRGTRATAAKTGPGGALERLVKEGAKEGLVEEAPQSFGESAAENIALGRPWDQGIGKATATGAMVGAAMGGSHASVAGHGEPAAQSAAAPSTPTPTSGPTPMQPPSTTGEAASPGPQQAPAPAAKAPDTSESEKALLKPVALTALDRVNEIDKESAQRSERLAELNDPTKGYGPMFDQERAELASQQQALETERASLAKDFPKAVPGLPASFTTEAGTRLQAKYALMDAGDLITSHDEGLRKNPLYPQELQPRERDRAASEMQVSGIVQKLDPARLGLSADAANGAPIVGADGLVESGNARTIALKRVYQANGQKAADYKTFLRDNAAQFGITPQSVDGMAKPVLVRVRTTPVNRAEFARQANASTVAAMAPSEQAKSDANRIDSMEDLAPDDNGDFSNAASRPFVQRFMARLPMTEQAGMVDANGNLSTTGYARVRNAVLAKAYGDSPVLARMTESMDDNLRNVSRAFMLAAPKVAAMRSAIKAGSRFDADITPDLMSASEELARIKTEGGSVADALAQTDIMGDQRTPEARQLLQFLADNMRRPRRMADFISAYMDALDAMGDPNQGSLLGETQAPAKKDLLTAAEKATQNEVQDGGQKGAGTDAKAGAQARRESEDAQGRGEGTQANGGSQRSEAAANDARQPDQGWVAFPSNTGTLRIPRAEMPQIKSDHRGALINFLEGHGIGHEQTELSPSDMKPTQAEFSPAKVEKFQQATTKKERSVLVSSDGYILDGHHQWVAHLAEQAPVKVIQFDAPIRKLLDKVAEFPSVGASDGATTLSGRDAADRDFKDALADLGQIMSKHTRVMMLPEDTPNLMPTLVKLMTATIKKGIYELSDLIESVKEALKTNEQFKTKWNRIANATYKKAAMQALEAHTAQDDDSGDLFGKLSGPKQGGLFDGLNNEAPKVAMIDGRAYNTERDNFNPPKTDTFIPAEILANARDQIARLLKAAAPIEVAEADRVRAEAMLKPIIERANAVKVEYDQKIIDIAKRSGAIGQMLANVKGMKRAIEKLATDPDVDFDTSKMYDMLRSTIVVRSYADAQAVVDAIRAEFEVLPGRIKDQTDAGIVAPELHKKVGFLPSGYGQVLINVRTSNGVTAEIQVNVPQMLAVKNAEGHKLYEIERAEPAGSQTQADAIAAQREIYPLAWAAAKKAASDILDQRSGHQSVGDMPSQGAFSFKTNRLPSGNSTYDSSTPSSSVKSIPNLQPGGKEAGTFIDSPHNNSIAQKTDNGYSSATSGETNANDTGGAVSTQGQGAGAAQATGRKRKADRVRQGPVTGNLFGDSLDDAGPTDGGQVGQAGTTGVRASDEVGGKPESGEGAGRNTGVPAGRDIPAKSGRNYEFGPDDLTYEGSWAKKAEQNVQAVELLRALEKEQRQATRDEQAVLAKFVGWGAGELANNLFGSKLDKHASALEEYKSASAAMDTLKRDYLQKGGQFRGQYADNGYYQATSVLRTAGKIGPHDYPQRVTRAELDAAKPDAGTQRWLELRDRLRAALTPAELAEASRSTQYAHYTSKAVVSSMWKAMDRMGFKGGHVLEPGAGIGVFAGLMPQATALNSTYTGIEFDSITGGILKQLFPDERILVESFVDSKLPKSFYDVAVGNPPFSGTKILGDPEYAKQAFSLHDYFFAKSIDRTKPGGLVVYVTSRYTMDKLDDKARAYLSARADMVGAIRLPQTAFKQNAGTEVVTDVIFLRKKVKGETFEHAQAWGKSVPMDVGGTKHNINEYFAAHPEMVLGQHSNTGSMYKENDYTVTPLSGDIEAHFAKAVENLPENIYQAERGSSAEAAKVREIDFNPKAKKEGNYYVSDAGVLMQREGGVGQRVELKSPKDVELVKDFVPLRDALKQAHYDQLSDGDWEASLKALQKAYQTFTKKHGQVNQFVAKTVNVKIDELDDEGNPTGRKVDDEDVRRKFTILDKLKDDPDWTLVAALENVNEDTGTIAPSSFLEKRVLLKAKPVAASTPMDAMLMTLNDIGKIDIPTIAQRVGLTQEQTIEALGTAVYNDPESGWVTADEYLSGDVKDKLHAARIAARSDRNFERNVSALEANQPEPLSPSQIDPRMGQNWIPADVYEQFVHDITEGRVGVKVSFDQRTKHWNVEGVHGSQSDASKETWGTQHRPLHELMDYAVTGRPLRVMTKAQGDDKATFDEGATEAAKAKLDALHEKFSSWAFSEPTRSDKLVRIYNDKFNTTKARKYDGSHLTLPGASTQFNIFNHVKRGAWRIIQSGNTYLAHAVGSGKTFQMVISAMEQKRLGLIQKPMMVVPNHMLKQFAHEWQQLYPAARLMVADEHNFHTDNRRRFVSRVALSDLDGVVITHSAFKLLDLDPAFKQKMIKEQLDFFRAALEEAGGDPDKLSVTETTDAKTGKAKVSVKGSGSRDPKIKRIEKQIENMEQKLLEATSSEGKDKNVRFDELGVDFLYVDEAHEFRKLDFTTNRQVKGVSPMGSARAFDLFMKSRYLESKTPGRSMVLASGTPVTNTMAELYTVQKLLGHQALVDKGIEDFDSWASMFGRETTTLEPNAAGKYEPVSRFQEFANVPELTQMFREFADVLTSDYLAEALGDDRPKVEGGARKIVATPETAEYLEFRDELDRRVTASKAWKPSAEEPNNPDPIIRIIGDGRLAAIDMRFINPALPSNPDSKLNRMADDVIAAFKETADVEYRGKDKKDANDKKIAGSGDVEPAKGSTMMVFSDLGFGAGAAASRGFNARAWFEKRLRDGGVDMNQVAFMSDYKKSSAKLKLFSDLNAGRVRVLVGSSKNMGTGVNAQQRLKNLFHLDSPWYPADLEQREGRIIRTGNKNKEVRITAYAGVGTFDQQMWNQLANKQMFIDKAMSGDPNVRRIEDAGAADLMRLASGMASKDPRVLQLAGINADIGKLQRLYQAHEDTRATYRGRFNEAKFVLEWNQARLPDAKNVADQAQDLSGDKFAAKVGGATFTERVKWAEALIAKYKDLTARGVTQVQKVGEISGFAIAYGGETVAGQYRTKLMLDTPSPTELVTDAGTSPMGVAMRAQNAVFDVARLPVKIQERIEQARATMDALSTKIDAAFPMLGMLSDKIRERDALMADMAATGKDKDAADQPKLSRGAGGGMETKTLRALAANIQAKMPNMPKVHVYASPADLPDSAKGLRDYITEQGAWSDVDGAMHNGELYLFASGMTDALRAEHVLAEHEAAHFGLRALLGDSLKVALQSIYNNNATVRQAAAELQRRGKLSNTDATEEVIVDIPSSQLVKLQGWRKLVQQARTWLADHGFEAMAAKLSTWLDGTVSDQQRADLMVANLVHAARAYMAGKRGKRADVGTDTMLSGTLAEDVAKQEQWLRVEAQTRGYKDIDTLAEKNYPLFEKLAELWRKKNPAENGVLLSRRFLPLVSPQSELESAIAEAIKQFEAAMAGTANGYVMAGRTPHVLSMFDVSPNPSTMLMPDHIADKVFRGKHGAEFNGVTPEMLVRAMYRPAMVFKDTSEQGNVSLVTNILTDTGPVVVNVQLNGTVNKQPAAMIKSIYTKGNGVLASWTRGNDKTRELLYADKLQAPEVITGRLNPENKNPTFKGWDLLAKESINTFGSDNRGATDSISNTRIVPKFGSPVNGNYAGWDTVAKTLQAKWDGARINGAMQPRLKDYGSLLAWIHKHYKGDPADRPRLSRAPAQAPTDTPAQRAEALIQSKAATAKPIDAIVKGLTRVTGVERLTTALYNRAAYLLDRHTPETIKAGMVSDYGVPEAVIDQRAMMQGRQRVQLRQAGSLVEKLATLTRAESRVAYEWMNETDPHTIYTMMHNLPEESVKVLMEVQGMIDNLSREAVRMGQLTQEAYDRNKFAYLRRSYAKYTLGQTASEKAGRARAISILGDQYKGRGLTESATMAQIQNAAPEWWQRKMVKGKADTSLKGEKFLRLERRAPSGERTKPLDGMEGKQAGRLKEVHYFPASERLPAKYADWTQAGTFEARDTKGGNVILWRDFTKDERENMGEIDEARFAIAKTLHAMIHDVEVGRYLEWLAHNYAKKEGETIPGVVVNASERYADTFKPGEWVKVPEGKIEGTSVLKYGKLAGRYLPGPVWNDLRQTVNGQFQPFGETYAKILALWKMSKTALSPAVHTNNIMSNVVMADWHDVTAGHTAKALRILLGAHSLDGAGALGRAGNLAAKSIGINDRAAAREVVNRYLDSGGNIGSWATNEVATKQIEPLLAAMEAELAATGGQSQQAQIGVMAALQHTLMLRLPSAFEALKGSKPGKVVGTEAATLIEMYQNEDEVFRLASWLKAKEEGKTDMEAGKIARRSFMDYNINAPWVQAMRNSALPFISYTYRAVPMMLEIAGKKPHKLMKLMLAAGALNALGVMLAGGGDDKERKLLPEEKAGRIWGMVPKLIRMPWNDKNASPVYLDIRRFVPVGDVFDVGAGHTSIPILPMMQIGGPVAMVEELYANRSNFTGKPIVLETDTASQKTAKVMDYLFKTFAPNILGLPGTYATTGVVDAAKGKTDAFGREQSVAQAVASALGVKLGSYPADVMRKNEAGKANAQMMEIDKNISLLKRQRQTNSIDDAEFRSKVQDEVDKKREVQKKLAEKLAQ